jgi:hypothetical protein
MSSDFVASTRPGPELAGAPGTLPSAADMDRALGVVSKDVVEDEDEFLPTLPGHCDRSVSPSSGAVSV